MRSRILLQVFCINAGILLAQSSSNSSSLTPRKNAAPHSYDPFIVCDLLGPTHAEGLPSEYSEDVYAELITLCSSAHGARQNIGCFCSAPNGRVHCSPHLADSDLWQANYTPDDDVIMHQYEQMGFPRGHMTFPELCTHTCECESRDNAELWFEQTLGGHRFESYVGISGYNQPEEPPRTGGNTFAAGSLNNNDQPDWQNQCGNNCTSAKDCGSSSGGNSTCMCQAHSSQYQPGSGTVAFIAACLVTLGSGGKREEGLPCPCNSTYVSHSCCDVSDGLVWESPESKLGVLLTSSQDPTIPHHES